MTGSRSRTVRSGPGLLVLCGLSLAIAVLPPKAASTSIVPGQEGAQREVFLRTADVVSAEFISEGITRPERVELEREIPLVVVGNNIYHYSGFARLCIEYAVASIRQQRPIDMLEFHLLLARN